MDPPGKAEGTQQLLGRCILTPVSSVLLEVNNIIFLWFYKTKKKKNPDVSDMKAERNIFQDVCEIKMYKHWYLRTGRLQMCWPEECWMKISGMLERSLAFIARKCVLLVFLHLFKRSLVSPVLPGPGREAWQQRQVRVFAGVLLCSSRTKRC